MYKNFRSETIEMCYKNLGFNGGYMGTHSVISVAAMSMFLDNVAVFLIMLVVRWSSGVKTFSAIYGDRRCKKHRY